MDHQHSTVPCVTLGLEQEEVVEGLRGKVKGLEQWIQTERYGFEELREMVVLLREKMDSSLGTTVTSQSNTRGSVPVGRINLARECDVIRKGIERSEKLITQLISTEIPKDYIDIALIRKCNTIDLPALQSASKTCEKVPIKISIFSRY